MVGSAISAAMFWATTLSSGSAMTLPAAALVNSHRGDDQSRTCLPPQALFYSHVMKTGGLSVDAYLNCRCASEGCSVAHDEGGAHKLGDPSCKKESICTSHAPVWNMRRCPSFLKPTTKKFTVLREPVSRVLSFYNYVRTPRNGDKWPGYRPYLEMSLEEVLRVWGIVDLDAGMSKEESCYYCANETSNRMVLHYFTTKEGQEEQNKWRLVAGVPIPPSIQALRLQLAGAKKVLASFDAIFFSPSDFATLFESSGLMPTHPEGSARPPTTCTVPFENPTKGEKIEPTETELQLLRDLNWADIELYKYAMTLPNVMKPKAD